MRIAPGFIDDLRQRVSLADYVGQFAELKRSGRNFKALCPFPNHNEKTPSFNVYEPDGVGGIFRCFGCGAKGNIYQFIEQYHNYSFVEAVQATADYARVDVVYDSRGAEHKRDLRDRILAMNQLAVQFFKRKLRESDGQEARNYLTERGIPQDQIEQFALGFAGSGWEGLVQLLRGRGFSDKDMQAAGLAVATSRGSLVDRFRGRLMFPIADRQDRVIAFGGRILPGPKADQLAKYVNSPETPLFRKSQTLYGLDLARPAWTSGHPAIIVEGYFDVIALHMAASKGVVAPLGTALTQEHLRLIARRLQDDAKELVLVFDADAAGLRAALQSIRLGFEAGLATTLVNLPKGQDPCDIVVAEGAAAWKERLAGRVDALGFLVGHEASLVDLQSSGGMLRFLTRMVDTFRDYLNEPIYDLAIDQICRVTQLSAEDVRERLAKMQRGSLQRVEPAVKRPRDADPAVSKPDRDLLLALMRSPESQLDPLLHALEPADFQSASAKALFDMMLDALAEGQNPDYAWLLEKAEPQDESVKALTVWLLNRLNDSRLSETFLGAEATQALKIAYGRLKQMRVDLVARHREMELDFEVYLKELDGIDTQLGAILNAHARHSIGTGSVESLSSES